jgi:hypothetical protein
MYPTLYLLGVNLTPSDVQARLAPYGRVYRCQRLVTKYGPTVRVQFGTLEDVRKAEAALKKERWQGPRPDVVTCEWASAVEFERLFLESEQVRSAS